MKKEICFRVGNSKEIDLVELFRVGIHLNPNRVKDELKKTLVTDVSENDALDAIYELGNFGLVRVIGGIRTNYLEMCKRANRARARHFINLTERPVEAAFGNN